MKLPAFLYGPYSEVKKAGRRMVTQLRRGVPWVELDDEFLDTAEVPGMLVLDGPSPLVVGEHFHLFVPARAIFDAVPERLPREAYVQLFEPMVATLWGFVSLLGQAGTPFLWPSGHQQRFLHALIDYWDELDAEGERYSGGLEYPERLWALPTKIKYCLANQGLPDERCRMPLPPGGIRELIAQTRAYDDDGQ